MPPTTSRSLARSMWSSTILSDSRTATRVSRGPTFTKISFRMQNPFGVRERGSAHTTSKVGGAVGRRRGRRAAHHEKSVPPGQFRRGERQDLAYAPNGVLGQPVLLEIPDPHSGP